MKVFERSRLTRVAQVLLGLLGLLVAVSPGFAAFDDTAMFALTDTSASCASAAKVLVVASASGNEAAVRSAANSGCLPSKEAVATGFVSDSGRVVNVKPEPGALLLLGFGIMGLVYLAVLRRKADER